MQFQQREVMAGDVAEMCLLLDIECLLEQGCQIAEVDAETTCHIGHGMTLGRRQKTLDKVALVVGSLLAGALLHADARREKESVRHSPTRQLLACQLPSLDLLQAPLCVYSFRHLPQGQFPHILLAMLHYKRIVLLTQTHIKLLHVGKVSKNPPQIHDS